MGLLVLKEFTVLGERPDTSHEVFEYPGYSSVLALKGRDMPAQGERPGLQEYPPPS